MFKKSLTIIASCVLALAMLTACSTNNSNEWERDANEHWQVSEAGKKVDVSAHSLSDDNVCSVCGSEIWKYDDGTADIYNYTEYGDFLRLSSYDADGNVVYDQQYEYEYDKNGNMLLKKQYEDGVLAEEIEYAVNSDGECNPTKQTNYFEDGTRSVCEYDEDGNIIKELAYDVSGIETLNADHEYAYNADGESYESKSTTYFTDGSKFMHEYNEYGDTLSWITYDASGNAEIDMRYEYEYDDDGNMVSSKEYTGDRLTSECEYNTELDGWKYCTKETVYNEDGTKTYYEYDKNGEIKVETAYDASGNVIE